MLYKVDVDGCNNSQNLHPERTSLITNDTPLDTYVIYPTTHSTQQEVVPDSPMDATDEATLVKHERAKVQNIRDADVTKCIREQHFSKSTYAIYDAATTNDATSTNDATTNTATTKLCTSTRQPQQAPQQDEQNSAQMFNNQSSQKCPIVPPSFAQEVQVKTNYTNRPSDTPLFASPGDIQCNKTSAQQEILQQTPSTSNCSPQVDTSAMETKQNCPTTLECITSHQAKPDKSFLGFDQINPLPDPNMMRNAQS
ncbi:Hypothetical predicted protein [Mytilus galloprovincialis]|uniref:Uncharacterized protein n=1 Tax=Mytilus galloprovincialis TaxID=29158 RepID=A0A8B6DBX5_MYTGA|nr:Hypothetical predicted protein [Mytilus galloprovincialis]